MCVYIYIYIYIYIYMIEGRVGERSWLRRLADEDCRRLLRGIAPEGRGVRYTLSFVYTGIHSVDKTIQIMMIIIMIIIIILIMIIMIRRAGEREGELQQDGERGVRGWEIRHTFADGRGPLGF